MPDALALALIFVTSLLVGYSGAAAPGPVTMMTIAASVRVGWRAGPLIATGHSLLELLLVGGLAVGAGAALQHRGLTAVVSVAGGAVLLWFAWGTLRSARQTSRIALAAVGAAPVRSTLALIGAGVVLSLGNPYWLLWWATIGAAYVLTALGQAGLLGLAAFYVGHILADYTWGTLVSALVHGGRRWLGGPLYQGLIALCGLALGVLGVVFLANGVRLLVL